MPRSTAHSRVPGIEGVDEQAEPQRSLHVDVVCEGGAWDAAIQAGDSIHAAVAALGAELSLREGEACIALSDDAHVADLNGTYRGMPKPTNVLSFPAGEAAAPFLGDVVLAQERLAREAAELGIPFEHHLQHLVVHGLLHLLGYDHGTDEEAQAMEGLETRILARLGIADPYAESEPRDAGHVSDRARS
jgi:probable rRNA maturation factor